MESPNMEKATIFQSNRSQAVRLPKAIAFPADVKRVEVLVMGRARMLIPAGESWESWFDGEGASADFMEHREQPADQVRESL
jgi:antitoxin VapB